MPVCYQIYSAQQCIVFRKYGTYTTQDCRTSTKSALAEPNYLPQMAQIYDLSDVTDFDANFAQISSLVTFLGEISSQVDQNTPLVIIAPKDIQFGMARMFQQLMDGRTPFDVHLVRNWAEAAKIVDLPPERFQEMLKISA
ncbi:hypothetical protein [Primorskyibacter sp. 2E233]|uniref:hypothetical protein n=1 Tax=Primorskyibacter sp. 2E233 TaxID=3413431 RepID=UPI003BF16A7A